MFYQKNTNTPLQHNVRVKLCWKNITNFSVGGYLGIIAALVVKAHPLTAFDSIGNTLTLNPMHRAALQEGAGLEAKDKNINECVA